MTEFWDIRKGVWEEVKMHQKEIEEEWPEELKEFVLGKMKEML